ncbi:retropepsin-like aspartic protease family protein [Piscinibacter sakaiensis]|uniref:retropepsin-like aspartic protease family protein n=1 Tax=Piscinibacter sakaiensis TaxID=1547922 RepID=UPI003AAE5AE2
MGPARAARTLVVLLAACGALSAMAGTQVALNGRMGNTAVLVIDGKVQPLAVGSSRQGVKLLSLGDDSAVVEVDGRRMTLRIGDTPIDLGGAPTSGQGTRIVLNMGSGGHFIGLGSINGRPVRFLVDTGASVVSLSQGEAERIGLAYRDAPRGLVRTANGTVPAHSVRLASVRIGDVQINDVDAVVMPAQMDHVLLGNSFLGRFQMRRDNDTMTLEKRP